MDEAISVWYDPEGDFLEVVLKKRPGYFKETALDQVMAKVDMEGRVIGFSILKVSELRGKPLEVSLTPSQLNWSAFTQGAPDLAALAEERFEKTGLALVGTIRKDGTPRISPIEPAVFEGHLLLGMMYQSRKALDLQRDPRCVLHTIITDKEGTEGEVKLRGRALDVTDQGLRERHAQDTFDRTGWRPEEPFHLFSLDIEDAAFVQYHGGERQTVKTWRAGQPVHEKVRRWTGSGYVD